MKQNSLVRIFLLSLMRTCQKKQKTKTKQKTNETKKATHREVKVINYINSISCMSID